MTAPKYQDLKLITAHEYVNRLPFGAKRWYGRAYLKFLMGETEIRPGAGQLRTGHVEQIQEKLKELLK